MKLLGSFVFEIHFAQLLNTINKEFQLFEEMVQNLDVLVVYRLVQQVIQAKATRDDEHKALV